MTGVSLQEDAEIGLGTFPIFWFIIHLKKMDFIRLTHRLAATQDAAFCVVYTFMDADEGCGDLPPTPPTHALKTCPTFSPVCLKIMHFDNTL